MRKHFFFSGVLAFLFILGNGQWNAVYAQEEPESAGYVQEEPEYIETSETVFYIRDITFNITGRSRPFALMYHGDFQKGTRIRGRENLELYLRHKTQLLYNQRVLASVSIEYSQGEADADGAIPVDLLIATVDSWNIIALPRPLLDDNEGFDLTIKARDYNFLGAMSPLRIDLGYNLKPEYVQNGFDAAKGSWNFEIDSDIPFRFLGYNWRFNFDHFFSYIYEINTYYKNVTGLSIDLPVALPFALSTITAGFDEFFVVNEENEERYKTDYGPYFKDWFMSSELYGLWKIPTGFWVYSFGELVYTPKLSGKINYRPGGDVDEPRRGPALALNQTLGFGQIDWVGNFRRGLNASIELSNEYNFHQWAWNNRLFLSATGHLPLTSFFSLSGRLQSRHWFNNYSDTAGDAIRGIINRELAADHMLSLNMDFTFKVLDFRPSIWFHQPKLRFFDLEFQLAPIIDLALARDPVRNIQFSPAEIQAGGGLELIVFSHFMRSLYLRVSIGYDLRKLFATGDFNKGREIFIGLYHHY